MVNVFILKNWKVINMKVIMKVSEERNGWVSVWAVDECNRLLHTEPVCTIPVGYGHKWFADYLADKQFEVGMVPLIDPCPPNLETEKTDDQVNTLERRRSKIEEYEVYFGMSAQEFLTKYRKGQHTGYASDSFESMHFIDLIRREDSKHNYINTD